MIRILVFTIMLVSFSFVSAQKYVPVDLGSSISFTIKNLGINVTGKFTGLSGTVVFDPANLSVSQFAVSVNTATVDTDIDARDTHLKKEDYFHVERYPKISFLSKSIKADGAGQYTVTGMLEIKGVVKEISFPFTANLGNEGYVFKGRFRINRRDFKIGGKSLILSDQLTVNLSVLTQKY